MEDLDKAIDWFQRNGSIVRFNALTPIPHEQLVEMKNLLSKISFFIRKDFPEYADRLFSLKNSLALQSGFVNVSTFGRLSESLSFIKILLEKYKNIPWQYIHPKFGEEPKERFLHGFYADAIFAATNILMDRLRKINRNIDPSSQDIDGADLVGKLFSNKDPKIILFNDNTNTGENKQRGYVEMFRGWVSAIRNGRAHDFLEKITEIEAFQELAFMSMLMTALDKRRTPQIFSDE